MRTLDKVLAWAMVVFGIIHSSATLTMRPADTGAVWFFSGGAAVIMAGLLNLIRIRHIGAFERGSAILANGLVIAVLAGITWFAFHRLAHEPQVWVAWAITAGELAFSLRGRQ
jgi:hypothetical protein